MTASKRKIVSVQRIPRKVQQALAMADSQTKKVIMETIRLKETGILNAIK